MVELETEVSRGSQYRLLFTQRYGFRGLFSLQLLPFLCARRTGAVLQAAQRFLTHPGGTQWCCIFYTCLMHNHNYSYSDPHVRGKQLAVIYDFWTCHLFVFRWQRGGQSLSYFAMTFLTVAWSSAGIMFALWLNDVIILLDLLIYMSNIKVAVTICKYVPQAYMNYKRKSTVGFSILGIVLDFGGGVMSTLQMFINAVNHSKFHSLSLSQLITGWFSCRKIYPTFISFTCY